MSSKSKEYQALELLGRGHDLAGWTARIALAEIIAGEELKSAKMEREEPEK